jgi:hypothetical protein
VLDGDFPAARHAQEELIAGVRYQGLSRSAEPGILADEPQESVGVEEQFHGM